MALSMSVCCETDGVAIVEDATGNGKRLGAGGEAGRAGNETSSHGREIRSLVL